MEGANPIFIDKKSKIGILMLHGFTSTPYQFRELGRFLAQKGFTVYAPLIAGHGTSPENLIKTTPDNWKSSVKDAYLKLKEKSSRIIIIGNSFGGNLAFWLAKELKNDPVAIVSLGTPIFLRFQWFIKLRYYLYGRFKKYYRKPQRVYRTDYTDMVDEVTYPVIPIKSFKEFLDFLRNETAPHLKEIKVPALVIHANVDWVVSPESATYIYEHLSSSFKRVYWFNSNYHTILNDARRKELFQKIYEFIRETI